MNENTPNTSKLEVRTRSVPTAAALVCAGFPVIGMLTTPLGTQTFRFAPEARPALEAFIFAKQDLDAMLAKGGV